MGKLNEWIKDNFSDEPVKPDEEKLNVIMSLPYSDFNKMKIWDIERAIFILSSWLYYIGYQFGVIEGRAKAITSAFNSELAFEAQKFKTGYFEERRELAKANSPTLTDKSIEVYKITAQANTLKEMKFGIKERVDILKMIYYRKRNDGRNA